MKKVVFISILAIFLIMFSFNCSHAADTSIWEQAKLWITNGKTILEDPDSDITLGSNDGWSKLAGILWGAGIWVSIISGAILGIRFMIVSPENRAKVKSSLMVWLIGSVVVIGALSIWRTIINLVDVF